VRARQSDLVDAGAHASANLGRDDDLLAWSRERSQRAADELFTFAFRVNVGGVDEVHARIERGTDERVGFALSELTDALPKPFPAERHRAETKLRDHRRL
jgi:hypothetical protein